MFTSGINKQWGRRLQWLLAGCWYFCPAESPVFLQSVLEVVELALRPCRQHYCYCYSHMFRPASPPVQLQPPARPVTRWEPNCPNKTPHLLWRTRQPRYPRLPPLLRRTISPLSRKACQDLGLNAQQAWERASGNQ